MEIEDRVTNMEDFLFFKSIRGRINWLQLILNNFIVEIN